MHGSSDQFVARATDDAFIKMLSNVLLRIVNENDSNKGVVTRFHSMNAPPISIANYVGRIARHVRCSNECFVLALVYIERITKMHKNFVVSVLNVHRLIITAVMLAAKFSDDVYYSNKFYAQVGGVNVAEINLLEAQFLNMLNFQLYVSAIEYESYRMAVEKANLFGCLSSSLWGVPWFHSSTKRPYRDDSMPVMGTMSITTPAMKYSHQQSTVSVCSTHYVDNSGNTDYGNWSYIDPYKGGALYSHTIDVGDSGQTMAMSQPSMEMLPFDAVYDQATGCQLPMNGYSYPCGNSTTAAYQMLSNVHVPQMVAPNCGGNIMMSTPIPHAVPLHTEMYNGNMGHYRTMEYPGVEYCSKHPRGSEKLHRRKPSFLLNRMCTHHIDVKDHKQPKSQWRAADGSSMDQLVPISTIDEHKESNEGCEVFMNALEARYRDPFKEKCAMKADSWKYYNSVDPYISRQLIQFNQSRENRYHM